MTAPTPFSLKRLIARIQRGLIASGETDIQPDGILGIRTQAAIREFQTVNGLTQTGQPDRALYSKIKEIGLFAPLGTKLPKEMKKEKKSKKKSKSDASGL